MSDLTLRSVKGSPLTHEEMDQNFQLNKFMNHERVEVVVPAGGTTFDATTTYHSIYSDGTPITTITGLSDHSVITLRKSSAVLSGNLVLEQTSTSAPNAVILPQGKVILTSPFDRIKLQRHGTAWVCIGVFYNNRSTEYLEDLQVTSGTIQVNQLYHTVAGQDGTGFVHYTGDPTSTVINSRDIEGSTTFEVITNIDDNGTLPIGSVITITKPNGRFVVFKESNTLGLDSPVVVLNSIHDVVQFTKQSSTRWNLSSFSDVNGMTRVVTIPEFVNGTDSADGYYITLYTKYSTVDTGDAGNVFNITSVRGYTTGSVSRDCTFSEVQISNAALGKVIFSRDLSSPDILWLPKDKVVIDNRTTIASFRKDGGIDQNSWTMTNYINNNNDAKIDQLAFIRSKMAAGESVKLAFYGDSTTDGTGTTGVQRTGTISVGYSIQSNVSSTTNSPTGKITTSTTSATVVGSGTTFTTDVAAGYALLTAANVLIGYVVSVESDTSLTLAANALSTNTAVAYHVRTNVLTGIGTTFTTLPVNSAVYTDPTKNSVLGFVVSVASDTSMTLDYVRRDISSTEVNVRTPIVTGVGTRFTTEVAPSGLLYDINKNLIGTIDSIQSDTKLTLTYGQQTVTVTSGAEYTYFITNANDPDPIHNNVAVGAYPAVLQTLLRDAYANNNITTFNAGYSGQKLNNGWAYDNYQANIIDLFGTPDVTFIAFGLNDVTQGGTQMYENITETRRLVERILADGTIPVILSADACGRIIGYDTLSNREVVREADDVKRDLAKQYGIPFIEMGREMKDWWAFNNDGYSWFAIQPDRLHVNDLGHAFKAGVLFKNLYADILEVDKDTLLTSIDSSANITLNGFYTKSRIKQGYTSITYNAEDKEIMVAWVWNTKPNTELIYRGVRHENYDLGAPFSTFAMGPEVRVEDGIEFGENVYNLNQTQFDPTITSYGWATDMPYRIQKLKYGLTKIIYKAGVIQPTSWAGCFEFAHTDNTEVYSDKNLNISTNTQNALKTFGEITKELSEITTQSYIVPEAFDKSNVYSGTNASAFEFLIEAKMVGSRVGLILGSSESYSSLVGDDHQMFSMLWKVNATDAVFIVGRNNYTNVDPLDADDHRWYQHRWVGQAAGAAITFPFDANNTLKIRVRVERQLTGQIAIPTNTADIDSLNGTQRVKFYNGWTGNTLIGEVNIPNGLAMMPFAGRAGGWVMNPTDTTTRSIAIKQFIIKQYYNQ